MIALKWTALAAAACIAVGLTSSVALAQGGGPANLNYTPSPTLSPYLYLFGNGNNGFGALNNYQAFVQPALAQNQLNAQQGTAINQLQQQLNQVRTSTGLGTTGFAGHIRPTGEAATYMNYSHYYTGANARR
jgi:hypothetical protein